MIAMLTPALRPVLTLRVLILVVFMCCFLPSDLVIAHNRLWLHDGDAYARFKTSLNLENLNLNGFHVCFLLSGVVFMPNWLTEWGLAAIIVKTERSTRFKTSFDFENLNLYRLHNVSSFLVWYLCLTDYTEYDLAAIIFKTDELARFKASFDLENLNLNGFHPYHLLSGPYIYA